LIDGRGITVAKNFLAFEEEIYVVLLNAEFAETGDAEDFLSLV
jgi:hypothetical protein